MSDFPKIMTTFIVITLFAFLIIGFATQLGQEYNKDDEVAELEERIGSSSVTEAIEGIESESEQWKTKFFEEEPEAEEGGWVSGILGTFTGILDIIGLLSVGIFNMVKNMGTFIFLPFLMFSHILTNVIGIPIIVSTILQVLMLLAIIFGIWRLIKQGY